LILACYFLLPFCVHAESNSKATRKIHSDLPVVSSIKISGNEAVTTDEIRSIMLTSKSSSFLGLGLFGGTPKPFSPEDFQKDISLIRKLYTFKGYFFSAIDTLITYRNNGKKVDLQIKINENDPSRIDSLRYEGIENVPADLQQQYLKAGILKRNDIFSVEHLIDERDRTIDFFKEYGYAYFHPDSIRIRVDTVGVKAGILFRIKLPEKLTYGPITAIIHDPLRKDDESSIQQFSQNGVSVKIYGRQKFSKDLITNYISYRPRQETRQSLEERTLQNFGSTSLFSSISISSDSVRTGELYTTLHLEPSPKHQLEPKILLDNRYGSLFIGASLAYENKNLFGGAEQLRLSTDFGTQTSFNNNLLVNLEEDQYSKAIPYELSLKGNLVKPLLSKQGTFYTTSIEYSRSTLPLLLTSRKGLVRGSYTSKLGTNSLFNFDFFEIEWVQKDSLRGFKQLFKTDLAENIGIDPDNETAVNHGLDSLLQTHLNQTFRLQYSYSNRYDPSPLKSTIYNLAVTLEEAGSLAWLIDNYLDTGSYAGFSEKDPQIFGTSYSQYVKLNTQCSFAKKTSPDRELAGRVQLGWMFPYGKAETTPEERRFYAGGANSMRGWLFNTLGPGSSSSEAAANFGADIKLELGLEYRMKLFKLFGQPSGLTFFTDLGNIWDRTGPYAFSWKSLTSDFAWDWGAGLRIGTPIGPFRFDFAYKIHDPAESDSWRIAHWKLSDYTFNFGIGEAF
jgi:outer membrane protein assembly factor BamA